jgi:hypothetical protein
MTSRSTSLNWVRFALVLLALLLGSALGTSSQRVTAASVLSATNVTINAGEEATISVRWTSTQPINFLNTAFVLIEDSGPIGGVSFKSNGAGFAFLPPPLNDPNYVFAGVSFAAMTAATVPTSGLASVYLTNWDDDTLLWTDTTDSLSDATQNGNKLWISFTISSLPTTAGTYRIKFGSNSEYDNDANFSAGNPAFALTDADLDGGLITVNAVSGAVPEPSMVVVGGILVAALGLRRYKQFGTTKERNRTTPR